MKRALFMLVFFVSMQTGFAANADKILMRSVEDAIEANSDTVKLPTYANGTLFFRDCHSCNVNPIRLTNDSKFFVNGAEVPLAIFTRYISDNNSVQLTIFHTPTDRTVTRVVAFVEQKK